MGEREFNEDQRDARQFTRPVVDQPGYPEPKAYRANQSACGVQGRTRSKAITLDNIDDVMTYQPADAFQQLAFDAVRLVLTVAAKTILTFAPDGPFRSAAIRDIVNARMNTNAAISFRGRF